MPRNPQELVSMLAQALFRSPGALALSSAVRDRTVKRGLDVGPLMLDGTTATFWVSSSRGPVSYIEIERRDGVATGEVVFVVRCRDEGVSSLVARFGAEDNLETVGRSVDVWLTRELDASGSG